MRERHLAKHAEMERLFGADFLPISRSAPAPSPAAPTAGKPSSDFETFRAQVLACTKCAELASTRRQVVFGVGSLQTPLVFVGEAPGEDEDREGEPFVGRAGQLLTKSLRKLGIMRSQVYIANILKCRPPGNRTPKLEEMSACIPYLFRQLQIIAPKIVCSMGNIATQTLLNTKTGITQLRGKYQDFNGMRIFPTFHPAYILRNMGDLSKFETDLNRVCQDAGLLAKP